MISLCPYCNTLKSARKGNHFCSQSGELTGAIGNNAYYIKAKDLQSGRHLSRLTIRYVFNGYQYHEVEDAGHLLKKENYLIINEGQSFNSIINSEEPVEALIVAFRPGFADWVYAQFSEKEKALLVNPLESDIPNLLPSFFSSSYPITEEIKAFFAQILNAMHDPESMLLQSDDIFLHLMKAMFFAQAKILHKINSIPVTKTATKIELYRRISLAKDYMDTHISEQLPLAAVSQIAALSPYHFLRTFKQFYDLTPHQYLTKTRLDYAEYMLKHSTKNIAQISSDCGFDNHSAFGRLFKKTYGFSPVHIKSSRNHGG